MLACAPHEPMLVILYMLCSSTPRSRKSQAAQCPQKEKQDGLRSRFGVGSHCQNEARTNERRRGGHLWTI